MSIGVGRELGGGVEMGQHTLFMVSNFVNVKFSWVVSAVKYQSTKCKNYQDAVCVLLGPHLCTYDSKPTDKRCVL